MKWDFVVLSLIYFRTASILFDLKNLNLSKLFERLTRRINSLFTRNSLDLTWNISIYVVYASRSDNSVLSFKNEQSLT